MIAINNNKKKMTGMNGTKFRRLICFIFLSLQFSDACIEGQKATAVNPSYIKGPAMAGQVILSLNIFC